MVKRIVIGLVAMVALAPMSWTEAEAQTCVQYRTIGGSSMCTMWQTKGVQVDVIFKQPCGPEGSGCFAFATADSTDNVVFCRDAAGQITRRDCFNQPVHFTGSTFGCEGKHEQDNEGSGGKGHDKGKHGCRANILLLPTGPGACGECASRCEAGEVCVDLTPIEMDTSVTAVAGGFSIGQFNGDAADDIVPVQQESSACTVDFGGKGPATACLIQEHCSINPNRIQFIPFPDEGELTPPGQKYQCDLTCVGEECLESSNGG